MRALRLLLLAGLAACVPDAAPAPADAGAPTVSEGPAAPAAPTEAPRGGPGCIRGGSTREEVRAVMGEPDSVSFGAWIYGRSSVAFGYGTVIDIENAGGEIIVC